MLSRLRDEPAHGGNAATEPTHILDPPRRLNLLDGLDLIRVCLSPTLRHKEAEKLAGRDNEDTLLRVQLKVDLAQVGKCLFQISHECRLVLGFDHYVIHIRFHISM